MSTELPNHAVRRREALRVTTLGTQDGDPLVVDRRSERIESWSGLWNALAAPCGLPSWFGRDLDACWDTIDQGAISETIDAQPLLIVRVASVGFFSPGNADGEAFAEVTNESRYAQLDAESG